MRRNGTLAAALGGILAVVLAGCAPPPGETRAPELLPVGTSSDISRFGGAPREASEAAFRQLGYTAVRRSGETTFWRNAQTDACAEALGAGDRLDTVEMRDAGAC